jgi:hypothetical protein
MQQDEIMVFGGSGSRKLVGRICEYLGVPVCASEVLRFSEGNLFVRILENVRGRSVYLVQSTSFPANDNFMELLFWIDAFKRASAQSVTAVVPYFSYAKGDKKDEPRVSVRARVCADAIEAAGADRMVTMDREPSPWTVRQEYRVYSAGVVVCDFEIKLDEKAIPTEVLEKLQVTTRTYRNIRQSDPCKPGSREWVYSAGHPPEWKRSLHRLESLDRRARHLI